MKNLYVLFLFIAAASFTGCQSNDDIPVAKDPQMIKLASPIVVEFDSTVVTLADYLLRPGQIDSMMFDPVFTIVVAPDSSTMTIKPQRRDFPRLSELKIWSKGYPYSLLLERTTRIYYRFTFDPQNKKYRKVLISGQMNEWTPSKGVLFEKDGKWHIDFRLFPGKYQYKLILDGKMVCDRTNPDSVSNNSGGYNSLLTLGNLSGTGMPELFTLKAEGKAFTLGTVNAIDTLFVFWENHLLDQRFQKKDSTGLTIIVPRKAKAYDRSYIRAWASNRNGISNEILVPLQNGKVVTDPADLTRADREAMIMYFLMVDRFMNGKPANDSPVKDPEIDPKVNYMGGDIAGITRAIEDGYFTNLGINALWISPITQNPLTGFIEYPAPHRKFSGYHGYWPVTLTTVDHRFGTSDEFRQMISEAHSKRINVVLDFVSHHAHKDYPAFIAHPEWMTQVELPGNRKNIRLWDEHRLTTWFDIFLPTFDLTKPEVANMVADSAAFWIREYGIDGFRHDAAKHVPENYWRTLNKKLNEQVVIPESRKVFQIGETFGSRELVGSYINPGMLDAQFEFNLYWDAKNSFAYDYSSFRELNYSLQQSFSYYGEHNLMGNITGNQDMTRFISYASGAIIPGEDEHEAGWKRDIQVKDTIGYRKLASLQAFNMTIPGIPVIYYGDEFGMPGAGDPDNRRMMKFDSLNPNESHLKGITTRLANFRAKSLPLIFGDFETLRVSDRFFVYMRSYFDKAVIVVFNKDKASKEIAFDLPERFIVQGFTTLMQHPVSLQDGKGTITLPGNSFELIYN